MSRTATRTPRRDTPPNRPGDPTGHAGRSGRASYAGRTDDATTGTPGALPSVEPGKILAEFPRTLPDGGPGVMRIALNEFDGRPLLHLRLHVQTRDRRFLPTKAGVTVRAGELDAVIAALTKARAAMLDGG